MQPCFYVCWLESTLVHLHACTCIYKYMHIIIKVPAKLRQAFLLLLVQYQCSSGLVSSMNSLQSTIIIL